MVLVASRSPLWWLISAVTTILIFEFIIKPKGSETPKAVVQNSSAKLIMTPKLKEALNLQDSDLKNIDSDLIKPFETPFEVYNENKKLLIPHCQALLEVAEKGYQPADPDLKVFESRAADCEALEYLKDGRLPQKSFLNDFDFSEKFFPLLSPALDLSLSEDESAEAQQAETQSKNWQSYNPHILLKMVDPYELAAQDSDEWTATYFIYGYGDFNGDGLQDVLVKREGVVSHGTFQSSRLFILSRSQSEGLIRIIDEK